MQLVEQVLHEWGVETGDAFTVVPAYGGYFRNVKAVISYRSQSIELLCAKGTLIVEGDGLSIARYFERDLVISGDIRTVSCEK